MLCLKQIQLEDFLKLLGYRFLKISPLNSNQKPAFILILFYFILIYFIYFLFYLLFFGVFFGSAFYLFFFSFIFISWRLITLQYCSSFCHILT